MANFGGQGHNWIYLIRQKNKAIKDIGVFYGRRASNRGDKRLRLIDGGDWGLANRRFFSFAPFSCTGKSGHFHTSESTQFQGYMYIIISIQFPLGI